MLELKREIAFGGDLERSKYKVLKCKLAKRLVLCFAWWVGLLVVCLGCGLIVLVLVSFVVWASRMVLLSFVARLGGFCLVVGLMLVVFEFCLRGVWHVGLVLLLKFL